MTSINQPRSVRLWLPAATLTFIVVVLCPLDQRAQATTGTDEFHVRLSEKEMRLASDDPAMITHLQKDLSFQRILSRNMPYVELLNDEGSNDPIIQYRMTIGDSRFHFGDDFLGVFALLGKTTPDVVIQSDVESNGDELIVDILSGGLAPGDVLRFKIDLDVDPAYSDEIFAYPDYRTVLFDMNGIAVYGPDPNQSGPEDNSMVWVTYDVEGSSPVETDPVALIDPEVDEAMAALVNEASTGCCCGFGRGSTNGGQSFGGGGGRPLNDPNDFMVSGGIPTPTVPEPSSIILSAMGLLGGGVVRRRWRARASAAAAGLVTG